MTKRVSLSFSMKYAKLISLKCKRRVPLSSGERGSLVKIVTYMNATVMCVPLLVFSTSIVKAELLDSPPTGSTTACHKAGWIQKESFTQRLKYFVHSVKLSKKHSVILTLDGHYSHSRNIEVIDCARENGMHIVCLPPHSTHCLLDFSYVQPLKTYYPQEVEIWLKNHSNRVVTHNQITGLVEKSYLKSATEGFVTNGFRKTGLFPCNRHVLMNMIPKESQRNITSCLFDNPVPSSRTAEE